MSAAGVIELRESRYARSLPPHRSPHLMHRYRFDHLAPPGVEHGRGQAWVRSATRARASFIIICDRHRNGRLSPTNTKRLMRGCAFH